MGVNWAAKLIQVLSVQQFWNIWVLNYTTIDIKMSVVLMKVYSFHIISFLTQNIYDVQADTLFQSDF